MTITHTTPEEVIKTLTEELQRVKQYNKDLVTIYCSTPPDEATDDEIATVLIAAYPDRYADIAIALIDHLARAKAPKRIAPTMSRQARQYYEAVEEHLTPMQIKMMRAFCMNFGRIVPREEVMKAVEMRKPTKAGLEAQICRLRKKLSRYQPELRLTPVNGLGYRLEERK